MVFDFVDKLFRSSQDSNDYPSEWQDAAQMMTSYYQDAASSVYYDPKMIAEYSQGKDVLNVPRDQQLICICIALDILVRRRNRLYSSQNIIVRSTDMEYRRLRGTDTLVRQLLRRKLPWTADTLEFVFRTLTNIKRYPLDYPVGSLITATKRYLESNQPTEALLDSLKILRGLVKSHNHADAKKVAQHLDQLIAGKEAAKRVSLIAGDAWTNKALEDLEEMSAAEQSIWNNLFFHLQTATASKPSKKWLKKLEGLLGDVNPSQFEVLVTSWFDLAGKSGNRPARAWRAWEVDPNLLFAKPNADLLKGLAWACIGINSATLARALGHLGEVCYKKIPGHGPKNLKVGNAAVIALLNMSDDEALAQLSRLNQRVKMPSAKKQIQKALLSAAEKRGISISEMEERVVPDFGLDTTGIIECEIGGILAQIDASSGLKPELRWERPDGKALKSPPASIKDDFADDIKSMRKTAKELQTAILAQRQRIESLYLQQRRWQAPDWQKFYLNHPLVSRLARRLIWQFSSAANQVTGIWFDGHIIDIKGQKLDWIDDDTTVELWHPVGKAIDDVRAWRDWLMDRQISQPFKQAHREVYVVTDAELNTATYSNRFAAHIIKQHQFHALCQINGWRYQLQGQWDSHNVPAFEIPAWELRAYFSVDYPGDIFNTTDVSPSGVFTLVSTDQVGFTTSNNDPIPVQDVPEIVFSEVMRTVDMFVAVCSIGADPNWYDGRGHQQYWHDYSFGDLNISSQNRREILQNLIPRLKIADKCTVGEKYLEVQGKIRRYKIHIGSGNILMEPNNQYLCIVPKVQLSGGAKNKVFLPFEGDSMLAIILSKAFMLVDESRIKDKSILSQIKRR